MQGYARKGAALHGLHEYARAAAAYEEGLKMEQGNAALTTGLADVRRVQARVEGAGTWDSSIGDPNLGVWAQRGSNSRPSDLE